MGIIDSDFYKNKKNFRPKFYGKKKFFIKFKYKLIKKYRKYRKNNRKYDVAYYKMKNKYKVMEKINGLRRMRKNLSRIYFSRNFSRNHRGLYFHFYKNIIHSNFFIDFSNFIILGEDKF